MSRSTWKLAFVDKYVLEKVNKSEKNKQSNSSIRIWSRRSTILPQWIGLIFEVYNGKSFITIKITDDMVGHKFGEFVETRQINKAVLSGQKLYGKKILKGKKNK